MSINQPIILLFNSSLLSRLWNTAKRAIEGFPDAITILGTTPLSVKFTQAQIQHILKRKRWYTCVPDTKAEDDITAFDCGDFIIDLRVDSALVSNFDDNQFNSSICE